MDYTISVNRNLSFFMIALSGRFDVRDLETCYLDMLDHANWKTGADVLWDATDCTFDHLGARDVRAIGEMTEKYREQRGNGKAAWVVGRDVDFGISRMFELLNKEKVVFDFRVFKTVEEAKEWIEGAAEG